MNQGKTVFSQIMDFLPLHEFRKCVKKYQGHYKVRKFSCLDQFLCMAFAQLTYRESLRDIETCLRSMNKKTYHMGFRSKISRATLADANEKRDWRIYADFAHILIHSTRKFYTNDSFGIELDQAIYALDSTTIDLCLSLFPWAQFRKRKSAVKIHTLLDLQSYIPCFIRVTSAAIHDVNILDHIVPEPGSLYIMDRAYVDFRRLYLLKEQASFFLVRTKNKVIYRRIYSRSVDKSTGLLCDQTVMLTGPLSKQKYPEQLRCIKYRDLETRTLFVFLTNNFTLPALTLTELYRSRWQIELFFKWIKQHLRIKAFYGTSINAVKIQIWIAITVYVLVARIKKLLNIDYSMYVILQILSITIFEKVPILQVFKNINYTNELGHSSNQLCLFDL